MQTKAERDRDSFRAVLEGAEYQNIDHFTQMTTDECRAVGVQAMLVTLEIIRKRDVLLEAMRKLHKSLQELNDCGDAGRMVQDDVETARAAIAAVTR
jgi:hypothetical protein